MLELRITISAAGVSSEYVALDAPQPKASLDEWNWGDPVPEYDDEPVEPKRSNFMERLGGVMNAPKAGPSFMERLKNVAK